MVLGFAGVKKVNYYGACQEACNTIREVGNIYNYNIEHNIIYSMDYHILFKHFLIDFQVA